MDQHSDSLEKKLESCPTSDVKEDMPRLSYFEHLLPGSLLCTAFSEDISLSLSCYAAEIALCAIPNWGYSYSGSITLPILGYFGLRTLFAAAINYKSDTEPNKRIRP